MVSHDWLLGFLEGHACFSIIIKRSKNSVGYQTQADFSIKLPAGEEGTLEEIRNALGIGHIYKTGNASMLKATKLEEIKKVVGFLQPLTFISKRKREEFDSWVKCISIIEEGRHLQKDGLLRIALLRDVQRSRKLEEKKFCNIRLDIDPCHVYHTEGRIPVDCSICWTEGGLKIGRKA